MVIFRLQNTPQGTHQAPSEEFLKKFTAVRKEY